MSSVPLDRHFALRKLHSLLGIVPIGAFLMFHLFENSLSTKGSEHFTDHVVHKIGSMPYVELMEIFFIAIPILFHGIYGVFIWFDAKSNVTKNHYFRNYMFLLQRVGGAIALVFIISHVWGTRLQVLLNDSVTKDNLFEYLAANLQNPLLLVWYIVGILASVIHLANGIWLALITWGVTIGPRSQKISSYVCVMIGVLLLVFSAKALYGFLTVGT